MQGICETGPTVYSPYPRRLESLTIWWCNCKGSTFYSVILRPWVLVRPDAQPTSTETPVGDCSSEDFRWIRVIWGLCQRDDWLCWMFQFPFGMIRLIVYNWWLRVFAWLLWVAGEILCWCNAARHSVFCVVRRVGSSSWVWHRGSPLILSCSDMLYSVWVLWIEVPCYSCPRLGRILQYIATLRCPCSWTNTSVSSIPSSLPTRI